MQVIDMRNLISILACLMLASCSSGPDIVQVGSDTYQIRKQSRTAALGVEGLRASAQQEATSYCASYASDAEILDEEDSRSFIPGDSSWVEVRFRCTPWR